MRDIFNNSRIFNVIWRWKLHLIVIGVIAMILTSVFTSPFFISPKFKSTARLYPTNTKTYSEESESEQLIEILNSSDIKNQMMETFNLVERYNISVDDPYYKTKCTKKYEENVDCKKTEYESIEIKVLDTDPNVASDMVDSLISFYNQKVNNMHKKRYNELAETYKRDLGVKLVEIDSLDKKMEIMRVKYGFLSYGVQVEQTTMGYMTALAEGVVDARLDEIIKVKENLEKKGGEFLLLEKKLQNDINIRDTLQRRYEKAYSAATQKMTYVTVVEKPYPADKKAYPVRWLIVLISLLACEFLSLVFVFIYDTMEPKKN